MGSVLFFFMAVVFFFLLFKIEKTLVAVFLSVVCVIRDSWEFEETRTAKLKQKRKLGVKRHWYTAREKAAFCLSLRLLWGL